MYIHTGTLNPDVVVMDFVSAANMTQLCRSMQTPPTPSFKKKLFKKKKKKS